MRTIGITGGVGSGKSEVIGYLKEHWDCAVLRSDDLARDLMKKGGACYEPVLSLFGPAAIRADGELDRKEIARLVFGNPGLLERLNEVTHPVVIAKIREAFEAERQRGRAFFFLESALLAEDKYNEICGELWYVYADEQVRRERLRASRGYSDARISRVMTSQEPDEVFRKKCDFVINNSGDFADTAAQIDARMNSYQ